MLKLIFKTIIKQNINKKTDKISGERILAAIFARYGDGVIAFKIAKEFADANPNKKILVVTTHQLLPYAKEFFGECAICVNKRNPFELLKTIYAIKKFNPDIGLNPWSFGDEARFFISLAKNYVDFKSFKEWSKVDNLYDRAREYFGLELRDRKFMAQTLPEKVNQIIFAPFSTDVTKTLSVEIAQKILDKFATLYPNAKILLCGFAKETVKIDWEYKFNFKRSSKSSCDFLDVIKSSDLFIGVDAGPLHLVQALGVFAVAIFGPTAPQTILDSYENAIIWRDKRLDGVFCFVESCKNPVCLIGDLVKPSALSSNVKLETTDCPLYIRQ